MITLVPDGVNLHYREEKGILEFLLSFLFTHQKRHKSIFFLGKAEGFHIHAPTYQQQSEPQTNPTLQNDVIVSAEIGWRVWAVMGRSGSIMYFNVAERPRVVTENISSVRSLIPDSQ